MGQHCWRLNIVSKAVWRKYIFFPKLCEFLVLSPNYGFKNSSIEHLHKEFFLNNIYIVYKFWRLRAYPLKILSVFVLVNSAKQLMMKSGEEELLMHPISARNFRRERLTHECRNFWHQRYVQYVERTSIKYCQGGFHTQARFTGHINQNIVISNSKKSLYIIYNNNKPKFISHNAQ